MPKKKRLGERRFVLRLPAELHKLISFLAKREGTSMNTLIVEELKRSLCEPEEKT